MPNWCENTLSLSNEDKSKIDALVANIESQEEAEGMFNYLRPRPEAEGDNWYSWNVENWGTKWDITLAEGSWERVDDNTISMYFDTAWAPPIALMEYLEQDGWSADLMYNEPGMGFCGHYTNELDILYEYDISDIDTIEEVKENDPELFDWANLESEYNWFLEQEEVDEA